MKIASELFKDDDRKTVAAAVAEAEKNTSGEIVPVVATSSGRYDRAEDIVGLLTGLLLVSIAWFFSSVGIDFSGWGAERSSAPCYLTVVILMVVGFVMGTVIASWLSEVRRPFIPVDEMMAEVEKAANESFQMFRIRNTAGSTGVLIYVSLFERMVRVIGDDAISMKVGQDQWKDICDTVVGAMANNRHTEGLCDGIEKAGTLLSEHFPRAEDDENELNNELQLID